MLNPNLETKSNAELKQFLQNCIDRATFACHSYCHAQKANICWNNNMNQHQQAHEVLKNLLNLYGNLEQPSIIEDTFKEVSERRLKDLNERISK